jgi:flagellar biosynthetic protein FlhB
MDQACKWMAVLAAVVLPIAGAALVTGVIVTFLQTGFLVAPKRISPKADKLNPINGIKRIFSLSGLVEAIKGLLKVAIVVIVAYQVLNANKTDLLNYQRMEFRQALSLLLSCIHTVSMRYCVALLVIGIADYSYQRWNTEKQLRMTRHEVKREFRDTEGDPHIRARRRQIQRSMLQQGISAEMPQADVVVTNPTHVAVALMYSGAEMPAPKVVARGQGAIAHRIKALAQTYGIAIVEEPPTARALYKSAGLGDYIPPVLYQAVAEVLAVVYRAAGERRERRLARIREQRRHRLQ